MGNLAKREVSVNRNLLTHLQATTFTCEDGHVADFDMRDLFREFILEVMDTSGVRQAEFGRRSGIIQSNLSAMGKGKRSGTWKQIEAMIHNKVVTPLELFERLFELASHHEHPSMKLPAPKLEREKLRERLLSGEIVSRAAVNVPKPQTGAQPLRPKLTERLQHRKTGGRG